MFILGIETSCDETSAAVVKNGTEVFSCAIASSKNEFQKSGGVIPEHAARKQLESILPVIDSALKEAKITLTQLDAIAITYGPGLLGSLLVGTSTARVLSEVTGKPLIPVHHTLGHLSSVWLGAEEEAPEFPALTLSVSGGHTDLWYRTKHTKGIRVSSTLDDAAGEAFDKGATLFGLPYPGGPALAKLALQGDETKLLFPQPLKKEGTLDFSFSGLKTSLKYLLRDLKTDDKNLLKSVAASYQFAICRHLTDQLAKSLERFSDVREIHVVGGVSANIRLREMLIELGKRQNVLVRWPVQLAYCTDNAAMIAAAAYFMHEERAESAPVWKTQATADLAEWLVPA